MSVKSYRMIIVEDSLALAAYYILRKLLEVNWSKKIISIFSLRMLVCITQLSWQWGHLNSRFRYISYHQLGASQSKNFMANSKPRKQACKANKTPVINCVQQKVSSSWPYLFNGKPLKVKVVDVDVEDKNKAKKNSNRRVFEELIPRSHCWTVSQVITAWMYFQSHQTCDQL